MQAEARDDVDRKRSISMDRLTEIHPERLFERMRFRVPHKTPDLRPFSI
jgi:hypothetical protein